jgi:hypothetical protein
MLVLTTTSNSHDISSNNKIRCSDEMTQKMHEQSCTTSRKVLVRWKSFVMASPDQRQLHT